MPSRRKIVRRKRRPLNSRTKRAKPFYPSWKDRVTFRNSSLMKGLMPPRYRTKCFLDFSVYVAIAGYAATTEKTMQIKFNSVHLPLAGVTAPFTFNPGSSGLTLAALQPVGLSQMVAANTVQSYYSNFRVYASKCSVLCIPQALGDTIILCIAARPSFSGAALDIQRAQEVPFSKTKVCNSGGNPKDNMLSSYLSSADLFGVSKTAIESDLSGNYSGINGVDPTDVGNWSIVTQTADNAANTGVITYQVKLTYYVEFWNPKISDQSVV